MLLRALRCGHRIAAPAVITSMEAIVGPEEMLTYLVRAQPRLAAREPRLPVNSLWCSFGRRCVPATPRL